jgi:hypothetical protein
MVVYVVRQNFENGLLDWVLHWPLPKLQACELPLEIFVAFSVQAADANS